MDFVLTIYIIICFMLASTTNGKQNSYTYLVHVHPNTNLKSLPTDFPIYHYKHVFPGFAAKLTKNDVNQLKTKEWFVSARRERTYTLHTTHSAGFLGLNEEGTGLWKMSKYGEGVIIGVLDTGIALDHPSFRDDGMPPPPSKWKGVCGFNLSSACNKKLIGARFYANDGTQLDVDGHGSHTSSIATGSFVNSANIFGNANGTASGMAPRAHVAMYKVCSQDRCNESHILAGMEDAINDGVDVLSLSIGGKSKPFHEDTIAIGAFRAMKRGIFVSCSAGNGGPFYQTLSNEAPWILTVGASTIDRQIRVSAKLGNGEILRGQSASKPEKNLVNKTFQLAYAGTNSTGAYCKLDSLNIANFKGKVVVCEDGVVTRSEKAMVVRNAGGVAMILVNQEPGGYTTLAEVYVLPYTHLSYKDSIVLKAYLNSTSSPTVTLYFERTIMGEANAPVVAAFSSRGPSLSSPGILKPDIIGPGVNILAAWPFTIDPSTPTFFNMISGTSMACPHLSGIVALIKSMHPQWSPAAIKSAILTTANHLDHGGSAIKDQNFATADVFGIGAGHVNPLKASNPGLIYDIHFTDYISYLCGLNYTNYQVSLIAEGDVNCTLESVILEQDLNYPTFSIKVVGSSSQTYTRMLTNVGEPAEYMIEINSPLGLEIRVQPTVLKFSKLNERLGYSITFVKSATEKATSTISQGYISWKSDKYSVRSTIAVQFDRYLYKNGVGMSTSFSLMFLRCSLIIACTLFVLYF